MPQFGSVKDGKIWAGADYGYQSPASFQNLEQAGELRVGSSIMRRLGQAFNQLIDAVPGGRDYANAVGQAMQEDAAAKKKPLELIGMDPTAPSATSNAIEFLSEKSNVNRDIIATGIGVTQGAIEGRLGVNAVKALRNKPRSVGAMGASRSRQMPDVFLSDDAVKQALQGPVKPPLKTSAPDVPQLSQQQLTGEMKSIQQRLAALSDKKFRDPNIPDDIEFNNIWRDAKGPVKAGNDPRQLSLDQVNDVSNNLVVRAPGGNNAGSGRRGQPAASKSSPALRELISGGDNNTKKQRVFDYLESKSANPRTTIPPKKAPLPGTTDRLPALTSKQREELAQFVENSRAKAAWRRGDRQMPSKRNLVKEQAVDAAFENFQDNALSQIESGGTEIDRPVILPRPTGRRTIPPAQPRPATRPSRQNPSPISRGPDGKPKGKVKTRSAQIEARLDARIKRDGSNPYRPAEKPVDYKGETPPLSSSRFIKQTNAPDQPPGQTGFVGTGELAGVKKGRGTDPIIARSQGAINQTRATIQGRLKRLVAMRENATGRQANSLEARIDALTELLDSLKNEAKR